MGVGEEVGQNEREGQDVAAERLGAIEMEFDLLDAAVAGGVRPRRGDSIRIHVEAHHALHAELDGGKGEDAFGAAVMTCAEGPPWLDDDRHATGSVPLLPWRRDPETPPHAVRGK